MPKKLTRKQMGLFGLIASGKKPRGKKIKMSKKAAREMLRGSKLKKGKK